MPPLSDDRSLPQSNVRSSLMPSWWGKLPSACPIRHKPDRLNRFIPPLSGGALAKMRIQLGALPQAEGPVVPAKTSEKGAMGVRRPRRSARCADFPRRRTVA